MSALKLKGSRLEAEVDKSRGECNWDRLKDLLPAIRSKSGGLDGIHHLVEGEIQLELFLSDEGTWREEWVIEVEASNCDLLRGAEESLQKALENAKTQTVVMEAHLLMAKLYFYCMNMHSCLHNIEQSQLDVAKTQFVTLRSLKLAAEGYALKGFALERTTPRKNPLHDPAWKRILGCFETSTELAISYIAELEKSLGSKPTTSAPKATSSSHTGSLLPNCSSLKIGALLEMALERTPYLSLRRCWNDRKMDLEGVEWYRRIMTELGDKATVEKLQQRLCRQLAEILLRGMMDRDSITNYEYSSRAIASKSKSLSFYTGSNRNYFAPHSRFEEIILLLMISEIIVSQNMRVSPTSHTTTDMQRNGELFTLGNLKTVQNLLVLVLSNLRQYHLLSSVYDRGMRFANEDRHMWTQYSLTLLCENRFECALKVLQRTATLALNSGLYHEEEIVECMLMAKLQVEQHGDSASAVRAAERAVLLSAGVPWLMGRSMLLLAMAHSMEARQRPNYEERRTAMTESIKKFERAIELDPHDESAHLLSALECAIFRDFGAANEKCQRCLDLRPGNPLAVMLMALLFTTKRDYKSALELVINSLIDFPSHYGLLVLRLKLEAKYGLVEDVMQTARKLLCFWRDSAPIGCESTSLDETELQTTILRQQQNGYNSLVSKSAPTTKQLMLAKASSSRDALLPTAPMFIAPLGINASCHSLVVVNSVVDASELASTAGGRSITAVSEHGVAPSTLTDGSTNVGVLSSSSRSLLSFHAFTAQADIWVELAEFFIDVNRIIDTQSCVQEACALFPGSHQALYLKGLLHAVRAEKLPEGEKPAKRKLMTEAKNSFLAALSLHHSHLPSLLQLGKLYACEENVDMAEKTLRDVIATDPFQFKAWNDLGKIIIRQGSRSDEANECFNTAASVELTAPLMPFSSIPMQLWIG